MPALSSNQLRRICINPKTPRLVRLDWLEQATAVSGKALSICVGLWLLMSIKQSATVSLTRRTMARVNISRYAATDALRRLEAAGLIKVWRLPGRSPMVTATEPRTSKPLQLTMSI